MSEYELYVLKHLQYFLTKGVDKNGTKKVTYLKNQ